MVIMVMMIVSCSSDDCNDYNGCAGDECNDGDDFDDDDENCVDDDKGNPYLLCGHLDVVPSGDLYQWDHPPFLGQVINQVHISWLE